MENLSSADEEWLTPDDVEMYVSLKSAKVACETLGSRCSGVTSALESSTSFTLRSGGLFSSPFGRAEVSHVKECGVLVGEFGKERENQQKRKLRERNIKSVGGERKDEGNQEHLIQCASGEFLRLQPVDEADRGGEDKEEDEEQQQSNATKLSKHGSLRCRWQEATEPSFLPGYAVSDEDDVGTGFRTLAAAMNACEVLEDSCSGVTMQPCLPDGVHYYTPRAEAPPLVSPRREISWVKFCGQSADSASGVIALEHDHFLMNGSSPSTSHCTKDTYKSYLHGVLEYYKTGTTNLNLLAAHSDTILFAANLGWELLAAECAPAALQCILLRLEERVYLNVEEFASLIKIYLHLAHSTLASDDVSRDIFEMWPLNVGWGHIDRIQKEIQDSKGRQLTHFRRSSVDFVLCYCGVTKAPLPGFPDVTDDLRWLVDLLEPDKAKYKKQTRIFIKEKCGDDNAALELHEALKVMLLTVAAVVDVEPVHDEVRADDATAYLTHLAGRRDDLADWTFFLHADAPEHIQPMRLLVDVLQAVRGGVFDYDKFPFLYLSHNHLDLGRSRFTWDDYSSPTLWKQVFGSSIAPPRSAVKGYCCVQFMVPRPRALLRPQSWYERALRWFASAKSYTSLFPVGRMVHQKDVWCRAPSQYWMPWWHVVFGEELAFPERHNDPRLPLFVQFRRTNLQ
eukprot:TRINITY_DN69243_c0_g1_i1.p1 TRINITY_DN69243_c0_g1~~TRINITY_DN69243_c0_g1_i1.p1  ORF type:complete len:787 (+),score=121.87 TRINITY_DN69243_c0_g1_i1:323-2362(+)